MQIFASAGANIISQFRLNGGVGNYGYSRRCFFITSSASAYSGLINDAMTAWVQTTQRAGVRNHSGTTRFDEKHPVRLLLIPNAPRQLEKAVGVHFYVNRINSGQPHRACPARNLYGTPSGVLTEHTAYFVIRLQMSLENATGSSIETPSIRSACVYRRDA